VQPAVTTAAATATSGPARLMASLSALEVKTGQTAKPERFRWLGHMRDALADKFMTGIALYTGSDVLPSGDRLLGAERSIAGLLIEILL
jgi:hypothetical protein